MVLGFYYGSSTMVVKMHPQVSSYCFRCCGHTRTMFHIWWQCPKVTRFWIRVFNWTWSVTRIHVSRAPEIALFQKLDTENPKNTRRKSSYMVLAARIATARCWNQSMVVFDYVKNWIGLVTNLHTPSKINNPSTTRLGILGFDTWWWTN